MKNEETIREGLESIAAALHRLGNADAGTPMGGLEALGKVLMDGLTEVASALHQIAEALNRR